MKIRIIAIMESRCLHYTTTDQNINMSVFAVYSLPEFWCQEQLPTIAEQPQDNNNTQFSDTQSIHGNKIIYYFYQVEIIVPSYQ